MSDMTVLEACARLKSLRQNLPGYDVEVRFINEFHQILDLLQQASDANLDNFRISQDEVQPIVVSGNYLDGSVENSRDRYCDHNFFLMKVDGVLMMFEVLLSSPAAAKAPIGFKPPGR